MSKESHRIKDPNIILQMLTLRSEGESYPRIANKFFLDHTSVLYYCRKYHVAKGKPLPANLNIIVTSNPKGLIMPVRPIKTKTGNTENINRGKMYSEYLKEDKYKKWKRMGIEPVVKKVSSFEFGTLKIDDRYKSDSDFNSTIENK